MNKADPAKYVTVSEAYEQNIGYPIWLAAAEDRLRAKPPRDAEELVEFSAKAMRRNDNFAEWNTLWQQCVSDLRGMGHPAPERLHSYQIMGPPGLLDSFGEMGGPVDTPIVRGHRGYYETMERNYPDRIVDGNVVLHEPIRFPYAVPGTDRELQLIQIGHADQLLERMRRRVLNEGGVATDHTTLFFLHPRIFDTGQYDDFLLCLQDQFEIASNAAAKKEDRKTAVGIMFWLMSQATPVTRGGTAHAKMVLEYMSDVAGFDVPHTRPGVDLWAEAVTLPVNVFLERFNQPDLFFDTGITSDSVMQWHRAQVQRAAHAAASVPAAPTGGVAPVDTSSHGGGPVPPL